VYAAVALTLQRPVAAAAAALGGCLAARLRERITRQIRWYYASVRRALGKGLPERLLRELDALAAELARFVPESSARGAPVAAARTRGNRNP